mmetsp:Transcript_57267/g.186185  ORF Transcript_57267/g.186185 Transcript_57267/m.186185 type:complete len:509 (-) Transcript_57267:61-1587(-)
MACITPQTTARARVQSPAPVLRSRSVGSGRPVAEATTKVLAEDQATKKSRGPSARAVQCYLLLGSRLFQQSMRNALAPLLVFMSAEFHIGTTEKGTLLSAIAAGYFFTQVPGGALADKFGAKNVVTAALTLSALCCLAIPAACDNFGVSGLWVVMALMGAVQGPLFPTSTVFLSRWMPKKVPGGTDEKAWGTSMLDIGISVGSLVVIPVANSLAGALGWRGAYYMIGVFSLAFVVLWQILGAEAPSKCHFISEVELRFLQEHVPQPSKKGNGKDSASSNAESAGWLGIPLRLALHPGLWAIFFAHIAFNFGAYYMTNWNPTYYAEVLRVPAAEAKYHLMMPHIFNLACKCLNPTLVTMVESRGYSLLSSRRLFTTIGFLAAAAFILPVHLLRNQSPWVSTFLFSLANAAFGLAPSGFKANYLDVTERYVGVVSGYGNTLGTVASWVAPQLVALILQKFGSWDAVLLMVAMVNVVAALNYLLRATVTPVERDVAEKAEVDMSESLSKTC